MPGVYTVLDKTAEVVMQYELQGEIVENVYYVLGTAEWTIGLLSSLCTDFAGWETDIASPHRCVGTTCQRISAIDRSTETGPRVDQTVTIAGTAVEEPVSNNVTIAVSWRTAKRGRRYRGRTFYVGLGSGFLAVGAQSVTAAAVPIIIGMYTNLMGVAFANGGKMVVAHQVEGGVRITPGTVEPITSVILVDQFIDSQRRRLPGHNRHR